MLWYLSPPPPPTSDRPVGAASCRRDLHTMASCQNPPPTSPVSPSGVSVTGAQKGGAGPGKGLKRSPPPPPARKPISPQPLFLQRQPPPPKSWEKMKCPEGNTNLGPFLGDTFLGAGHPFSRTAVLPVPGPHCRSHALCRAVPCRAPPTPVTPLQRG